MSRVIVTVRLPERLRERADARVVAGDYPSRSALIEEATRRTVLGLELRERIEEDPDLDVEDVMIDGVEAVEGIESDGGVRE